jgi:hypothetical protein
LRALCRGELVRGFEAVEVVNAGEGGMTHAEALL